MAAAGCLCDIDIYDGIARQLAKRSGLRLVSVDYALAPEHPFPIPLDDCVAAVRWVLGERRAGVRHRSGARRHRRRFVRRQSRARDLPEAAPIRTDPAARRRAGLRLLFRRHRHAVEPRLWRRRLPDLEARDGMVLGELCADRRRAQRSARRAAARRSQGPAAALHRRRRVRRAARRFRTARGARQARRRRDRIPAVEGHDPCLLQPDRLDRRHGSGGRPDRRVPAARDMRK